MMRKCFVIGLPLPKSFIHSFIQYFFFEGLPCEGIPEQRIGQVRSLLLWGLDSSGREREMIN